MKKHLFTILLVLVFFVGLSVLLYPAVSDYWNSKVQSHAIADLEKTISNMEQEDISSLFAQADAYNATLRKVSCPLINFGEIPGYSDILNVSGTGVIGYISIEKIKVELPIYHTTDPAVLRIAAGHLEGSSFPVGGPGTHAVLSAHRGLPSAKLFTNLDKLEIGDSFTITVLDRVLTYEVDQILIVEPDEVGPLAVTEGEDYCTLVTCTPYGINSHRLLVRGTRVETAAPKPPIFVTNDADRIDPLIVTPAVLAPMLLTLLVALLVKYRKKK